ARADGGRLDVQADRGQERIRRLAQPLDRGPRADRPLDADGRRLAEADLEPVVARERRLDDLLLYLAVERDGELAARVVLPEADERVLLGQLAERDPERALVRGPRRDDDGLEGRRGEVVLGAWPRLADRLADPDLG